MENSKNGKVNAETKFTFSQDGDLVTADYHGGSIRYGKIIAKLKNVKLQMPYHCMTIDNELKAGKADAKMSLDENGKIKLKLNWEWLEENQGKGTSEYIEN